MMNSYAVFVNDDNDRCYVDVTLASSASEAERQVAEWAGKVENCCAWGIGDLCMLVAKMAKLEEE